MNSNLDLKQIKAKGHDEKDTYSVYGKRNYTDEWVKLGEELNESETLGIIREYRLTATNIEKLDKKL